MTPPNRGCRPPIEVVVGLIEDHNGRVLVNRRRAGAHMAGYWEFPGGKRGPGEGREDALRRELFEELGIRLLAAHPLIDISHDYPDRTVHLDVWRVERYTGEVSPREHQTLSWWYPEELMEKGLLPADAPIVEALLAQQSTSRNRTSRAT